jgi:hypothetical protein
VLYRARDHLDADAAKIFEAVVRAMQQEQEQEQKQEQKQKQGQERADT